MRKLFLTMGLILTLMFVPLVSFAGDASVRTKVLADSDGAAISSYSLTSGSAVFSETILVDKNRGFASILVVEDKAGGAGDVDVSAEYCLATKALCNSSTSTYWYTAHSSDMAGTVTADGNIVTALGDTANDTPKGGWIAHTVRLAPYIHYKFDPDADSQITATMIFQRDR